MPMNYAEEAIGVALGADPGMSRYVLIVGLPVAGGLISGFLVFKFAPETEGHGTDSMIRAFHRLKGEIRARVPLLKAVASGVTIGFGGSAGKEGPLAQIGAGLGSVLSEKLKTIQTMEQLLDSVRLDGRQTGAINDRREQKFLDARDQQQALLDRAMARLDREEQRSVRLQNEFEANEKILEDIGETLRIRLGNFGELFGVMRQVAGEIIATVRNSIVS